MRKLFAVLDPLTHDGITIAIDGDRLFITSLIEGRERTIVLTEPGVAARLAEALLDAKPRRTAKTPALVALERSATEALATEKEPA
jgi:hypothetical protein